MGSSQTKDKDALKGLYNKDTVCGWKQIIELYEEIFRRKLAPDSRSDTQGNKRPKWIYRGQRSDWKLETTLDRAFEKYGIKGERDRRAVEKAMLRSFMRKAHHYLAQEPSSDDLLEWLAIMRHYGAPTRLFDWTYSFWVAVYNAVENWDREKQNANNAPNAKEGPRKDSGKPPEKDVERWPVVWALDAAWLKKDKDLSKQEARAAKGIDETRHKDNYVVKYLMTRKLKVLVYSATGFGLNVRLTAQQGTFLVQGTLADSFSENLRKSLKLKSKEHFWRICLKIDGYGRDEILRELNNMSINHATLYPDLEGFGKSLERHMAYPENWGLAIKKQY